MSKQIVIIGPAYPLRGGLASYDERLAREFNSLGFQTTIYTFSLQYPGFLFPGTTQYSSDPAPADLKIKVCINSINPLNWIRVGWELRKLKPDVIVVRFWLPFMGPCLGTILRIVRGNHFSRITAITDNIVPHEKRFGDVPFTKYFLKPVSAFITMSEKVMNDLKRFTDQPVTYVKHPLYDNFGDIIAKDEARRYLKLDKEKKILLFFGLIRKYKGLDLLLDAMRIIKEQHAALNIQLMIAGEYYEDAQKYIHLINKNNIEDVVIQHTHFIPDSEIKYYLCAADVVVQPYRNATQSGVTPLAYHFEIPMIVTNVGGLPSLVPEGQVGLIAEPHAASIAEKIIEFFQYSREDFVQHIREEKKQYSWKNLVDAILNTGR